MMLAQVRDIVMNVLVFLIRMLAVRGRGRVRDALMNSFVVAVHVMVAQIVMMAVVVAVVMAVVVMMVVAARVVEIVLFGDKVSVFGDVFSAHRHHFVGFLHRSIFLRSDDERSN